MTENIEEVFDLLAIRGELITTIDIRKNTGKRHQQFVRLRGCIIALLDKNTKCKLIELAAVLNLNHTSVMYYKKTHLDRLNNDPEYHYLYDELSQYLASILIDKNQSDIITVLGMIKNISTF